MAGKRIVQCIGPSYFLADRKSAVQRSVNLYMRGIEGVGEDRAVVLDSAPGLVQVVDLGQPTRGQYAVEGRHFVVAGDTLHEISNGTAIIRGRLRTAGGPVSIKHGQDQMVLVDGENGYVLNLPSNSFSPITDPDWRGSYVVEWMDGYFVFVAPGTEQFYLSAIDNASNLDALDFSSADAQPDDIVCAKVLRRELMFLGTRSIETWVNSGDPDFPFARYNSTPVDVGVVGRRAAVIAADSLVWVGQTDRGRGYVYQMVGHQPQRISTQAVEEQLALSSDLSQAVMWTYHVAGNEFVGISAPGVPTTWVYDAAIRQWHERAELVEGEWQPLRVDRVSSVNGTQMATGGTKVYRIDPAAYTLAGDVLARERTWPHLVAPSGEPVVYRSLEVECTTGLGGQMTLEISNDGGFTFGPPLARFLGAVGRWMHRVRWHFLGASRDRVFRLRVTDPIPLTIHGATVEAQGG